MNSIADDFNTITSFLAKRDIDNLSAEELLKKYNIKQADLLIILGSGIPYIAEAGAKAYKNNLAKKIMIVGGIGHSTKYLVSNITGSEKYKGILVNSRPEADILADVLVKTEDIQKSDIIIENKSTNCGSNAAEALNTLKKLNKTPGTVILLQDPTMQLRTNLCFEKEWKEQSSVFINYAPFIPFLKCRGNSLEFIISTIYGLWDMNRFISLVLGEVPRLKDDENGYGPKGKGYIGHIDIPENVLSSYERLLKIYYKQNLRG